MLLSKCHIQIVIRKMTNKGIAMLCQHIDDSLRDCFITKPTMLKCLKRVIGQIGLLRAIVRIFSPVCKSKIASVGTTIICLFDTTLVTIKTTLKTTVKHFGLFLNYFQCKWFFLRLIFIFAINWPWNFKVMTPFDRSRSKTYVQKSILWKSPEYVPRYFTFSNFLLWQWLPWKHAIFPKCSMMPAWHHSDSWDGRSWDA